MAQGCHLIYSNSDREQFPLNKTIERPTVEEVGKQFNSTFNLEWHKIPSQGLVIEEPSGIKIDERRAGSSFGISKEKLNTFSARFANLEPKHQALVSGLLTARRDRQADIITGLGNHALNKDMAGKIPDALDHLLKHDKNTTGLFNQIRKGQSPWISNLKNTGTGKADGIAFEVLAASKMLRTPIKGRPISIGDRLDFGPKLQASYGGGGDINVTDGKTKSIFSQPHRKTVEADLMITQSPMDGGKEIGVDFKHSIGTASITRQQLEGVAVALKTGEVDEWHFVSNTRFSGSVKKDLQEINKDLEDDNKPVIQLHQNFDWR
jgi:hypothetical protein